MLTLRQVCSWNGSRSAMCVQDFNDSLGLAIRITYRISLRSSLMWEPRHPLLKVVGCLQFLNPVKWRHTNLCRGPATKATTTARWRGLVNDSGSMLVRVASRQARPVGIIIQKAPSRKSWSSRPGTGEVRASFAKKDTRPNSRAILVLVAHLPSKHNVGPVERGQAYERRGQTCN